MIKQAVKESGLNAKVAISGWGWLAHQFKPFDKQLSKDITFSCINHDLGFSPVPLAFKELKDREAWAISWLEDDTSLSTPQLFVGRTGKDALDAKNMGVVGHMGLHWRTRTISPAFGMLALAGWEQPPHKDEPLRNTIGSIGTYHEINYPERSLRTDDFYLDWCKAQFGDNVHKQAAGSFFLQNDGVLPRPTSWKIEDCFWGPGGISENDTLPWAQVKRKVCLRRPICSFESRGSGKGQPKRVSITGLISSGS